MARQHQSRLLCEADRHFRSKPGRPDAASDIVSLVSPTDEPETFKVKVGMNRVEIDSRVFALLFENSHRRTYVPIRNALTSGSIGFSDLADHARAAQIPLPLFFAPYEVAAAQVAHKTQALLSGTSKNAFSMNARSPVRLSDVELIVKDLLRKQQLLKRIDDDLVDNEVIGRLRSRRPRTIAEDANRLRGLVGVDLKAFRGERGKTGSLDHLIRCFESKQLLVSRNQPGYMLQVVPPGVTFSGLAVKDAKIPYLFLGSSDDHYFEPAGRKTFTLVLLAALVAYGKFAPVSYTESTRVQGTRREYDVAAEFLMPAQEVTPLAFGSLDDAKEHAQTFRVTPSAFVMRAWRLEKIKVGQADQYLAELRREWNNRPKRSGGGSASAVNAVKSYCGQELFSRMVAHMRADRINPTEFNRNICLNKLTGGTVRGLRALE